MPGAKLSWTLVFTAASLEHLAEREMEAEDVANAVFGRYGPVRVRRGGSGHRERWFVVAPLEGGELVTCVLRAAERRDLETEGAFVVPPTRVPELRGALDSSMRLCVTAWISHEDESRSYRAWRRSKGGR